MPDGSESTAKKTLFAEISFSFTMMLIPEFRMWAFISETTVFSMLPQQRVRLCFPMQAIGSILIWHGAGGFFKFRQLFRNCNIDMKKAIPPRREMNVRGLIKIKEDVILA